MNSIPSGVKALTDFLDKNSLSSLSPLFSEAPNPEDAFREIAKNMIKSFCHRNGIWNDTPVELKYQSHWVNIFNTSKVEA